MLIFIMDTSFLTFSGLPHGFNTSKTVCLISSNPKKMYKEMVEKTGAPVTKVISTKQIRQRYITTKSQLELAKRFDIFICDG